MARKKKIKTEDLHASVNNEQSDESLASKNQVSTKTFQNAKKEYKKGKLNLSYEKQSGDEKPPDISGINESLEDSKQAERVDYDVVARGIVSTIDGLFRMGSMISKGKLEYEPLEKEDIDICVNALKQETQILDFVVKYGLTHATTIFMLLGVFLPRIKIRKDKPKPEKIEEQPSPTEQIKKAGLKKVSIPKEKPLEPSEEDKEFMEIDENTFATKNDVSIIDNTDPTSFHETPQSRDENYGKPPKNVKGKVGING